jgi:hypothetical protein
MRKKRDDGQRDGVVTGYGYTKLNDGRIQIAPCLLRSFEDALDRERGLGNFIAATNAYLGEQFTQLSITKRKFWSEIKADISDQDVSREDKEFWSYEYGGFLTVKRPDPGETKAKP